MRVKITENQLKLIKSKLNEDVDIVSNFENFCKQKAVELNKLYSKVNMITISELINKEVNIEPIIDYLWDMENIELRGKRKKVENYIESLPDEGEDDYSGEYYKLESRVYKAEEIVVSKIDAIKFILEPLAELQNEFNYKELSNAFSDVKPIDITPYQG